jgi:hypothetical protein
MKIRKKIHYVALFMCIAANTGLMAEQLWTDPEDAFEQTLQDSDSQSQVDSALNQCMADCMQVDDALHCGMRCDDLTTDLREEPLDVVNIE